MSIHTNSPPTYHFIVSATKCLLAGMKNTKKVQHILGNIACEYQVSSSIREEFLRHGIKAGIVLQVVREIIVFSDQNQKEASISEEFGLLSVILWSNVDQIIDAPQIPDDTAIQIIQHYLAIIQTGIIPLGFPDKETTKTKELNYICFRLNQILNENDSRQEVRSMIEKLAMLAIQQKKNFPNITKVTCVYFNENDCPLMNIDREWVKLAFEAGGISLGMTLMGGILLQNTDNEKYQNMLHKYLFIGGFLQLWDDWYDYEKDQKKGQKTFVTQHGKSKALEGWILKQKILADKYAIELGVIAPTALHIYKSALVATKFMTNE